MVHLQTFLGENLGDGKEKAVEFQSLCFVVGIGYCARSRSLRLTPFPSARRRGLNKITSQGVDKSTTLFLLLYPYKQVCRDTVSKIKDVEFLRHLLASFFVVDRGLATALVYTRSA